MLVYTVVEGDVSKFSNNILTPTAPGDFIIEVTIGDLTVNTSVIAIDDSTPIVAIQDLSPDFGDSFDGSQNSTSNIITVGLLLGNDRQIPNIMGLNGPIISDLILFESSNPEIISIDESTGVMKLLQNSYEPVTITCLVANETSSVLGTIDVYGNLQPTLGDADFGSNTGSIIPQLKMSDNFELPIYINAENNDVGNDRG